VALENGAQQGILPRQLKAVADAGAVVLDRADAQPESLGNFPARQSIADQADDMALARRQSVMALVHPPNVGEPRSWPE